MLPCKHIQIGLLEDFCGNKKSVNSGKDDYYEGSLDCAKCKKMKQGYEPVKMIKCKCRECGGKGYVMKADFGK